MGRTSGRRTAAWIALAVGIGAIGFGVRFAMLERSGFRVVGAYDDGVYYAAAVDLIHGQLLYRDIMFLQPPGIVLVMTPFARLGSFVGDATAFAAGRLAFTMIGGVSSALVVLVLRRFGLPAAILGGVGYAVASTAVYDERTILLEPIGTLLVLVALLALAAARREAPRWWLIGGVAAGAAIGFKIWYAPLFLVLLIAARGGRLRFLVAGAVAGGAMYLPFFLNDPATMWNDVVVAQLGRPGLDVPIGARLLSITGVRGGGGPSPFPGVPATPVLAALCLVALVLLALAMTLPGARVFIGLTAVGLVILLAAPSYFAHYTAAVTPWLTLGCAAGASVLLGRVSAGAVRSALVVAAVIALVALNALHDGRAYGRRPPVEALRAAAATVHGCVLSDDPEILAVTGLLTPEVVAGCDIRADPTGILYTSARYLIDGRPVLRDRNPVFQRAIVAYLRSGAAHVVVRGSVLALSPAREAELNRGTVLVSGAGFRLIANR